MNLRERVRAALRPEVRPEFRFTREGRVFVLVTLGVGIGAVNTGNNLLYLVLGLLLGLLLTSGVLSEIVLRGLVVERVGTPRLFAEAPGLFGLRVRNTKRRFGSTSFEVSDVVEGETEPPSVYVARLEPGESADVVIERIAARRGHLAGTHVRVRTRFPFGILEKSRVVRRPARFLVYPALVPIPELPRRASNRGIEVPRGTAGPGVDVLGLREHRAGDALRDVHARRSATLARPVVREREAEGDDPVLIELARRRTASAEAVAAFERDVRVAASTAVAAAEQGRAFTLRDECEVLVTARQRADLEEALTLLATVEALPPELVP